MKHSTRLQDIVKKDAMTTWYHVTCEMSLYKSQSHVSSSPTSHSFLEYFYVRYARIQDSNEQKYLHFPPPSETRLNNVQQKPKVHVFSLSFALFDITTQRRPKSPYHATANVKLPTFTIHFTFAKFALSRKIPPECRNLQPSSTCLPRDKSTLREQTQSDQISKTNQTDNQLNYEKPRKFPLPSPPCNFLL